jgi:hypothetical protein
LSGVSVTLNGATVPVLAVARANGQEQINCQIPFELAGASRATLVVTANGASSAPVEINLSASQPEIFAITRSGDTATIWATGLGPVSNPPATGAPAGADSLSRTSGVTTVTIGGTEVPVSFSGLAPGYAGLYQVNVTVPAGASGDVVLRVGSAASRPVGL